MTLTMNKLFKKLRFHGIKNYTQLFFCLTFAIVLVTSFCLMLQTKIVKNTLPEGGDSLKQVYLIFTLAVIGCFIFTLYASSLFLRYKSKETGIFLVLGVRKKALRRALLVELSQIFIGCMVLSFGLSVLVTFIIWQLFAVTFFSHVDMSFQLSAKALLIGGLFSIAIFIAVIVQVIIFSNRSNLVNIMNEERRSEPLPKVTKRYGVSGCLMIVSGLVLGYGGPQLLSLVGLLMPALWNITYIFSLVGLYRLLVYLISNSKKGRHPQKYYRHLINHNMMKFQGKQTVRNMLICSLLLAASLFALFYPPQLLSAMGSFNHSPVDFAFHFRESDHDLNRETILGLANKHQLSITDYQEITFSELIVSGVERNWDHKGKLIEDYHKEYMLADFMSVSLFNQLSGKHLELETGKYLRVIQPETKESYFEKYDDLDMITNPVTKEKLSVRFEGTVAYQPLVNNGNIRYIINDADYEGISQKLSSSNRSKQLFFNSVNQEGSFEFSQELYNEFLAQASPEMAVQIYHDNQLEKWKKESGEIYDYDEKISLREDNSELMQYWKYYPVMKAYIAKTSFQNLSVFYLVFLYIAIICLAAVGIISYTRGISIGMSNKLLFEDLHKLGASDFYLARVIRKQLRKIIVMPTLIGTSLISAYTVIILWGNDGQIGTTDWVNLRLNSLMILLVCMYQFFTYRGTLKKLYKLLELKR